MAGGTRSYEMGRRLVAWGHEVHMITTDRDGRFPKDKIWHETEEAGIHVHWTPVPYGNAMPYNERIKAFFAFSWRAARRAVAIGGDIVFATSTPLTIAIPGVYASKRLGIPMVFEVRDLWPEVPIALGALKNPLTIAAAQWLERFAYRNAAHIVALAPGMKEHVAGKGYPEDKITVIPNGADVELFNVSPAEGQIIRKKYNWLGNRPLIVSCGTLGAVNGIDQLIDLAAEINKINQDVCFVVLGSGKEEIKLKEHARSVGILDSVFFMLGTIPKLDVPKWLSAADACAVFYEGPEIVWKDSVPNKFFDCLAAGKPFISNIAGWSQAIAAKSGSGIIINSKNLAESSNEILEFIFNKNKLTLAREHSRKLANGVFNRSRLAKELEIILLKSHKLKGE